MSILKDSFKKFWNNCKTQGIVSTTEAGLMSAIDKQRLGAIYDDYYESRTNSALNVYPEAGKVTLTLEDASIISKNTDLAIDLPCATETAAGVMSANDKAKLNGMNFGGVCVGANVDFPTKATSFMVNTFCNDINQTSQSDMRAKTVGCIRVADNYRAIKVSSDGSTLSFNVDNTNITIEGMRASGNTLTISNPTGLTISEIRMFLI